MTTKLKVTFWRWDDLIPINMDHRDVLRDRGIFQKGRWPYCLSVCLKSCFPLAHAVNKQGGGLGFWVYWWLLGQCVTLTVSLRVFSLQRRLKRSLRYGIIIWTPQSICNVFQSTVLKVGLQEKSKKQTSYFCESDTWRCSYKDSEKEKQSKQTKPKHSFHQNLLPSLHPSTVLLSMVHKACKMYCTSWE